MKILEGLHQGSPEWMAARANYFTASEAPAMLGLSKYTTRGELLRQKASGVIPEVGAAKQRLFDSGHAAEALARPIAELIMGDDLYPVTGVLEVDGLQLLASFDGLTMSEEEGWENKLWNAEFADHIESTGDAPDTHWPQLEQQALISRAKRILFTVSDGTEDKTVFIWYESKPERRAQLIAGWKQFAKDLADYQHVEPAPVAVAAPITDLPAIVLTVAGALTIETNFDIWAVELNNFIARIPAKPTSDQEFVDCKAAVAALKKAETQLDAEEARVLSHVPSIDDMKRQKKLLRDLSSSTRLALEKLVVARDIAIRTEITQAGATAMAAHIAALNKRIGMAMPIVSADFSGVMKNKRTIASLRDAVDTELARAKIAANETADRIEINLRTLREMAGEHSNLFPDAATIVLKASDDLEMLIRARIAEHLAAESKRVEAMREVIRAEEQFKAHSEALAESEKAIRIAKEVAPQPAPAASSSRLEETAAVATPVLVTGNARLRDLIDTALIDCNGKELQKILDSINSIRSQRKAAA